VAFAGAAPAGEEVPRLKPGALQRRDWAAEIAAAKRSTWGMMLLFALLIAAVGWAVGYWMMGSGELGAAAAAAVAAVALAGAWFGGPSAILATAGARPADREKDRVFVNVVEEISLAAGVPVPRAFVIETGEANAFATGRDPGRASVAVTRGLLESLNRDQLQAVVAHELGHVRNYDIRYMMIIAALVGVVVLLADVVRRYWWLGGRGRSRSSGGRGGGQAQLVLMVVSLLLILLAPLFARMLQMAVSRRREYLADASAVEFTRNPLALAEALEKIKYHDVMDPETPVDPESDERRTRNRALQHLYIVNPVKEILETTPSLFATHPPINHRIRRLREMVL
jgi:heat shock protein HtpX